MNAADKKEIATKTMRALLGGDAATANAHLADDVSWIMMAKTLNNALPAITSKKQVVDRSMGSKAMFPEGIKTTIHHVFHDGDTVLVEFSNLAKTAKGPIYDNDYCIAFEFEGDKIKTIREYQDSLHTYQTFLQSAPQTH